MHRGREPKDGSSPIFFCAQKNQLKKIFQCSEFPTAVNGNGNAVCGVSDLPGTGCSAGKTFQEALSLCVGAGARLCTLQEVLDNEVRLSGCNNFGRRNPLSTQQCHCLPMISRLFNFNPVA